MSNRNVKTPQKLKKNYHKLKPIQKKPGVTDNGSD